MAFLTRRRFLDAALRTSAGAVVAGSHALSAFAQEASAPTSLIVHSARPQDLETPVHLLTSWITPNNLFYVRSHFYTPTIREEMFALQIDGEVGASLTLSMDALMRMPPRTMPVTLECAGNGRGYYDPPVAGVQWRKGAVGTARWTGVPLADVLTKAGLKPTARFLWLDGADTALGRAPDFIRSLPIDKAMRGDALLAYAMNGERLSPEHGFPLRVIVPGWEGAYSVKWLTHITVSDRDHPGAFVSTAYRVPRYPVAPGTLVESAATVPIRGLMVKSIITSPVDGAVLKRAQPLTIGGFAWGGENDIRAVDISTDGGRSWLAARLGHDRAPYTWRQFSASWTPEEAGSHVLLVRATDDRGRRQPFAPDWNPGGYAWDAVDRVRVDVPPS